MTSHHRGRSPLLAGLALALVASFARGDEFAAPLPEGVKAVWDLHKASRDATPTRERVCINGLWRWQPAGARDEQVPSKSWGYFKVPGCWPGITDYMQKDSQTLYPHPTWTDARLPALTTAWYEREVTVPTAWAGRRIAVNVEYLNSFAVVFVDGQRAGEIRFPGGRLDVSTLCRPGATHRLSMLVAAMPLKAVMLSYSDTASAREVRGTVPRRGLCGDVFLESDPQRERIADVRVEPSFRQGRIALDAGLEGLAAEAEYTLRARVRDGSRDAVEFTSKLLTARDLAAGRAGFSAEWKPERLWDIHKPGNVYTLELSLVDAAGRVLDAAQPVRFGFREFWIDGRDFYLNGSRIFLSAVPLDNAQVDASLAGYAGARESLERLKAIGINFVYTHNYGCEPGSHLGFAEVLRAADDVGMLVGFSQPHFSHYDWKGADPERDNGYARHAEFYVRRAQNHPSVVLYTMSHNATGYAEDMNPDMIDGIHDPRDRGGRNNARLALRAEAIVHRLDPSRPVYHHAGGNIGSMHTSNFYPNFTPIQELSDWFEHWATKGVKPMFTCEYGAPFTWDWSMYRGWYKGQRSFGSARVPWEFCFAEWNAQFLGDRAFRLGEPEKANLRWEAQKFRAGSLWHRWDYPNEIGSRKFADRHEVIGMYLTDNLRAFRTWGVSATSPWELGHFWSPRDGVERSRKTLAVDWEGLQRPGFSPDFIGQRYDRMDLAFERSDWLPTADGQAIVRNNRPLLGYIAGPTSGFTGKGHNVLPGETLEKQLIVLNNSREMVDCDCAWSLDIPGGLSGRAHVKVATGQEARVPVELALPANVAPGTYALKATFRFDGGESQEDSFAIDVMLPPPAIAKSLARIAVFDPKGETSKLLDSLGVTTQAVGANADLSAFDVLVVGKGALQADAPGPRIDRVRDGLKVVVFEQTAEVLEKRLGFRLQEHGLRQVFPRIPDHPLLAGLGIGHLRDWRGEATILPPRLAYRLRPQHGPTVDWCDLPVSRPWRCGNRGNVASVLIEKPARGSFLPVLDGGFSLQYSPLLEYREGRGMVLFCQADVTGRTEYDPAALTLARNVVQYAAGWAPSPRREVVYAGGRAGLEHLKAAGIAARGFDAAKLTPGDVLVVGPGGGRELAAAAEAVAGWLKGGGHALAIGLGDEEANAFLPLRVGMRNAEHIGAAIGPFGARSPLVGVGPADVHNRDPRRIPLVVSGAEVQGDGVLAVGEGSVVFCQLVPWDFGDYREKPNIKRTYRRASFLVSRLLANMGVQAETPVLERVREPVVPGVAAAPRWQAGLYLDQPEESDDPYRFFRW